MQSKVRHGYFNYTSPPPQSHKVHVRDLTELFLSLQVTEIVSKIKAKCELDCKAKDIVTIEDGDLDYGAAVDKFVNLLKGDPGSNTIRGLLS